MHQNLLRGLVVLVIAGALLTIAQVWGMWLQWDVFVKLIATIGILVLLLAFLLVVKADFGQQKRLKDDNYLD
jgi:hypothetical protein